MTDRLPGAVGRPWRTGRRVGRTVYAMAGDTPSDDDALIGLMDTRSLAQAAVTAHNLAFAATDTGDGPCAGCGHQPGEHPIHCDGWLDAVPDEFPAGLAVQAGAKPAINSGPAGSPTVDLVMTSPGGPASTPAYGCRRCGRNVHAEPNGPWLHAGTDDPRCLAAEVLRGED